MRAHKNIGDVKANITIDETYPKARSSFNCGTDKEQYWFEISRQLSGDPTEKDIFYFDENNRLKWDIHFQTKPKTNIFEWQIEAQKDVEFLYQTPLTIEERLEGIQRELDIDGSYAVYIKDKSGHYKNSDGSTRINYATGKLAHIPRPLCIDNNGDNQWADIEIKQISSGSHTLKITIPQNFLDECSYPLILDPTVGYTTVGGTYSNILQTFGIVNYNTTASESGIAETIKFFSKTQYSGFKVSLYDNFTSADRLLNSYTSSAIASLVWSSVDVSSEAFNIVESTDYYVAFKVDAGGHGYYYDLGVTGNLRYTFETYAGDMPDPSAATAATTSKVSLYLEYFGPTITLTEPAADKIYPRIASDSGTIPVSGTYSNSPTIDHIQARIVNAPAGAAVSGFDWTTIDATPTGGTFSEEFTLVPTGGPYELQVRSRDNLDVVLDTDEGVNDFFIGVNYLITGQSNAGEWFQAGQHTGDENYTAHAQVKSYYNSWATPTFDGAVTFGNAMRSALSMPIGLVTSPVYASPISDWDDGDAAYEAAVTRVNAVEGIEGIVWIQGESDGFAGTTEATYNTALTTLISNWRAETNIPSNCPFVISLLGRYDGIICTDAEWETIREAERAVTAAGTNVYLIETFDHAIMNGNHRNALGYSKEARKAAQALLYHLSEVTDYRSPPIVYTVIDATYIDILITHVLGTDFTPTTGIEAFSVTGSGVSVTAAVRTDASTIRLTISGGTSNVTGIFLGYGKQGSLTEANFPRDNAALALEVGTVGLTFQSGEIAELLSVDCTLGNSNILANNTVVLQTISINSTVGNLNITGIDVTVESTITVSCTVSNINILAIGADVLQTILVNCTLGNINITGINPDVLQTISVNCTLGNINILAYSVQITQDVVANCSLGNINILGYDIVVEATTNINLTAGNINIRAYDTRVIIDVQITGVLSIDMQILDAVTITLSI